MKYNIDINLPILVCGDFSIDAINGDYNIIGTKKDNLTRVQYYFDKDT